MKNWLPEVYEDINKNFDHEHLERILHIVRQPSIAGTGEGIKECAQIVMDMLTELGCENVHLEHYVHSPVVEGTLKAGVPNAPSIMMYGMYDVQPPEPLDEWTVDPWGGTIKEYAPYGECVVSRGIANSKGPLVAFLNAVHSIKKVLGYVPVNIRFVVEGEEEMGSESLFEYVKAHKEELAELDGVFLNGPRQDEKGRPFTILGNKGILYLDLEVTGGDWGGPNQVDVHGLNAAWLGSPVWYLVQALSSMRDKDDNILIEGFYDDLEPIAAADELLTQRMIEVFDEEMYLKDHLQAQRFFKGLQGGEALRHLLWQPTLNIDGIRAGYTGPATKTIIPYKAQAKMDVRLVPPMTADKTLARIETHLHKHGFDGVKITKRQGTPWSKDDPTSVISRACLMAMDNSGYADGSPWPIFPGSGPGYLFTQLGIDYVSYGLGQSGRIHAPDEWMTVKGLRENEMSCAAFLYYLTKLSAEQQQKQTKEKNI
jgi:acetylornithine deacetylase/succinyl-diaminopimelate desuccinylase-like protein